MEREKRPSVALFQGMTAEEKEHLKSAYEGSSMLLERTLGRLLKSKIAGSYASIDDAAVYDKPNVQMYLADQAGYRRALKEVLSLLP